MKIGLCYRCEHRAVFNETIKSPHPTMPRMQCGDVGVNVIGCYMYRPVLPVILRKDKDDPRPQFAGAMISSRSEVNRVAKAELRYACNSLTTKLRAAKAGEDGEILYWDVSEEVLRDEFVLWFPFKYRLYITYHLELFRSDEPGVFRRILGRIYNNIVAVIDWISRKWWLYYNGTKIKDIDKSDWRHSPWQK